MTPLTERQQEVLDAIRDLTMERGMPPTIQELGARIGVSSTGSAHQLVWALIRKGYVTRDRYKWRSLRVVGDPVLVSIPVALPEEVAKAVKWHAARLCGGNVSEMVCRIVAGWAACNSVEESGGVMNECRRFFNGVTGRNEARIEADGPVGVATVYRVYKGVDAEEVCSTHGTWEAALMDYETYINQRRKETPR